MAPEASSGADHRELTAELERLAARLRELGAAEVWLFGSLARGAVHEGSDLLVVMDTPLPFVERLAHVYRELGPSFELAVARR